MCGLMYTPQFKQTGDGYCLEISDALSLILETFISVERYLCSHI